MFVRGQGIRKILTQAYQLATRFFFGSFFPSQLLPIGDVVVQAPAGVDVISILFFQDLSLLNRFFECSTINLSASKPRNEINYSGPLILLDPEKLGWNVSVFIEVRLEKQVVIYLQEFEEYIKSYPEVMECYLMTGNAEYLLRVVAKDLKLLQIFVTDRLDGIPNVANLRSSITLNQVKYNTALPIGPPGS